MALISSSQEDYLKTIYLENLKGNFITNKLISDKMNVSAPSVSDMLGKLTRLNYLKKDEDYGYKVTNEGIELTQTLLKKHRLWEVFL
ncbi:MAG TPA: metal-dependent transcriptional regulator, partial [Erysipelothrix sp.]|nr:metal-dependent transcriptional regulator [Erysipelothrix sp.]